MCPMANVYELGDRPQKGTVEKSQTENLLKEEGIGTTGNVSRDKEYLFETRSAIKEIATIPAKTTMLHTRKESIIVKAEEDPIKPWYFTHV